MKTTNELIEELQQLVKTDPALGEVPVYVIADHGQTFIQAAGCSVDHTLEGYEYYAEAVDLEDVDSEDIEHVRTFVTVGD